MGISDESTWHQSRLYKQWESQPQKAASIPFTGITRDYHFPIIPEKLNSGDDLSKQPDLLGNAPEKLCNTSSEVLTLGILGISIRR